MYGQGALGHLRAQSFEHSRAAHPSEYVIMYRGPRFFVELQVAHACPCFRMLSADSRRMLTYGLLSKQILIHVEFQSRMRLPTSRVQIPYLPDNHRRLGISI